VTLNGSTWHSHSLAEFLSFLGAFIGQKVKKGRGLPRTPWQTALGRKTGGERSLFSIWHELMGYEMAIGSKILERLDPWK
jgi:hypothetical protein